MGQPADSTDTDDERSVSHTRAEVDRGGRRAADWEAGTSNDREIADIESSQRSAGSTWDESSSTGIASKEATSQGSSESPDGDNGPLQFDCSRRAVLAGALGTGALMAPGSRSAAGTSGDGTLEVAIYTGPTPLYARLRDGPRGLMSNWTSAHRDAAAAVEGALEQIVTYGAETGRDWMNASVTRSGSIGSPLGVASPLDGFGSADRLFEHFTSVVEERRSDAGVSAHLLLWWGPLDYEIGYGRIVPGSDHVAAGGPGDGLAIANVGATDLWDGRPVTRGIAIHEMLHPFLPSDVVESVIESRCSHDLGAVTADENGGRTVTPMATAYAGPDRPGSDTRFQGRGCVNHDAFERHDGIEDVETWRHTTELSEETLESVCQYAESYLA